MFLTFSDRLQHPCEPKRTSAGSENRWINIYTSILRATQSIFHRWSIPARIKISVYVEVSRHVCLHWEKWGPDHGSPSLLQQKQWLRSQHLRMSIPWTLSYQSHKLEVRDNGHRAPTTGDWKCAEEQGVQVQSRGCTSNPEHLRFSITENPTNTRWEDRHCRRISKHPQTQTRITKEVPFRVPSNR